MLVHADEPSVSEFRPHPVIRCFIFSQCC